MSGDAGTGGETLGGAADRVARAGVGGAVGEAADEAGIEWLDIVDGSNRVIGRAPRDVVHREGRLHRSVHVLLLDGRGRVFVQRRSLAKDTNPGLWDTSAAGHVDSGEGCLEAARRELHEELGVRGGADELQRIGSLSPAPENGFEFVEVYRVVSDDPLTLQESEIAEGRWVAPDELVAWMDASPDVFTDVFRAVWEMTAP